MLKKCFALKSKAVTSHRSPKKNAKLELRGRSSLFCRNKLAASPYSFPVHESDEGYSVSVPGLPGCWSQGKTEAEALDNIKDAIREYLAVVDENLKGADIREVDVGV